MSSNAIRNRRILGQIVEHLDKEKAMSDRPRTRSEVIKARLNKPMIGCCDRFADYQACDCLEKAIPDDPSVSIQNSPKLDYIKYYGKPDERSTYGAPIESSGVVIEYANRPMEMEYVKPELAGTELELSVIKQTCDLFRRLNKMQRKRCLNWLELTNQELEDEGK